MILLLMLIVALMLAWGLTDMQLSAPIERPDPPLPAMPVVTKKAPPQPPLEVPQAEAVPAAPDEPAPPPMAEMPVPPAAELPPP